MECSYITNYVHCVLGGNTIIVKMAIIFKCTANCIWCNY